jgi:hypothetical protein
MASVAAARANATQAAKPNREENLDKPEHRSLASTLVEAPI